MKTIGAGALPRRIPEVLDAVKAGERYTVTRRDKGTKWKDEPVAVLLPVSSNRSAERLHRLREDDLDFLLGYLLRFNAEGRGISQQMATRAREIHDRLQGERV